MGFTVVQIAGSHLNLPVLAADVCEHTGFTDLAIELVTTIFPNYPKKLHNFESCWQNKRLRPTLSKGYGKS